MQNAPAKHAYRFRAECRADVERLRALLPDIDYTIQAYADGIPDVDVLLETHMEMETIRTVMKRVDDAHMMVETINTAHEYTGARWYPYPMWEQLGMPKPVQQPK